MAIIDATANRVLGVRRKRPLRHSRRGLLAQFLHGAANFLLSFRIETAFHQREQTPVFSQQMRAHPLNIAAATFRYFLPVLATLRPLLDALEKRLLRNLARVVFPPHAFYGCREALHVSLERGIQNLFLLFNMSMKNKRNLP